MTIIEMDPDGSFDTAAKHTYDNYSRWDSFGDIDFSLPLFASLPESQREAMSQILALSDNELKALPLDQADTVRSYKAMYEAQLRHKHDPAPVVPEEPAAKPDSPEATPYALAEATWRQVAAAEAARKQRDDEATARQKADKVDAALSDMVFADTGEKLKRVQRAKKARDRQAQIADRRAQFAAIRDLIA